MILLAHLLGLFGFTYVRIDGEIYRAHDVLGFYVVYIGGSAYPLRSDGTAGSFSHCRWEHVAGPKLA